MVAMPALVQNQRVNRTQQAIRKAFTKLVMQRRFDQVTVGDIVAAANVGRSTFYLHFKSKEDVLKSVMGAMLRDLAAVAADESDPARLRGLLAHFWSNRRLGEATFGGAMGAQLTRLLAERIEQIIRTNDGPSDAEPTAVRLRALQLAAGQISLIHAWLKGEISAEIEQVAAALRGIAAPRPFGPAV